MPVEGARHQRQSLSGVGHHHLRPGRASSPLHHRRHGAISERGLDAEGNLKGFLLGGPNLGASSSGEFSVKRIGDFDVSDCAVTPKGDLLVLERSFSRLRGVGMRIRRVPLASVTPGATADGPALIEADMSYQIDNMEGLSVHRAPSGELVLTLISDDNFSIIQRTILLQFTLDQ